MKTKKMLETLAFLEERLKESPPAEAAKLTKKIVSLKNEWLNQ